MSPQTLEGSSLILLPITVDNQRSYIVPVIPIGYTGFSGKKTVPRKKRIVKEEPKKHVIHKAISWQKMLDDGVVRSLGEIAKNEGLTRARVTQIMNLLKLPAKTQKFLLLLNDPKEIQRHSERRLRRSFSSLFERMRQNTANHHNEKV
jgi:hypothetical protein